MRLTRIACDGCGRYFMTAESTLATALPGGCTCGGRFCGPAGRVSHEARFGEKPVAWSPILGFKASPPEQRHL
ncbi:MAG: hypothetical protein H0W96_15180 [Solirubrobacterales bacterium]|nr:hypothetical protein [Solirubrobacterales bacterium]